MLTIIPFGLHWPLVVGNSISYLFLQLVCLRNRLLTAVILLSFVFITATSLCFTPMWGHHELASSCCQNVVWISVCKYCGFKGDVSEWKKVYYKCF
jgi:hypothetical protein